MQISAGQAASRGLALPAALSVEILAQAAIAQLQHEAGEGADRAAPESAGIKLLVGVEGAKFERRLEPGMTLRAKVELLGSFGRMTKVSGRLHDEGGDVVAEASLLLADAE